MSKIHGDNVHPHTACLPSSSSRLRHIADSGAAARAALQEAELRSLASGTLRAASPAQEECREGTKSVSTGNRF